MGGAYLPLVITVRDGTTGCAGLGGSPEGFFELEAALSGTVHSMEFAARVLCELPCS